MSNDAARERPHSTDATPSHVPVVVLEFELTESDMAAIYRSAMVAAPGARAQMAKARGYLWGWVVVAVAVSGLFLAGVANPGAAPAGPNQFPFLLAAGGLGVGIVWWIVYQYVRALGPDGLERRIAEALRSEACQYHLGRVRLAAGPTGIDYSSPHHDTVQRWSGILDVQENPDSVCILRRDGAAYVAPRRVFASSADAAAFAANARGWLEGSGHGHGQALRAYLTDRDVPCPACGYNLRNVITTGCPECGAALDLGLIA